MNQQGHDAINSLRGQVNTDYHIIGYKKIIIKSYIRFQVDFLHFPTSLSKPDEIYWVASVPAFKASLIFDLQERNLATVKDVTDQVYKFLSMPIKQDNSW